MDNYHLTNTPAGWVIKKEHTNFPVKTFPTKAAALSGAAALFDTDPASLKIHRGDGTIEEERTYPRSLDPVESEG
jgi:hypothetical protein